MITTFILIAAGVLAGLVNYFYIYLNLPSERKAVDVATGTEDASSWEYPKLTYYLALCGYVVIGLVGAFLTPLLDALITLKGTPMADGAEWVMFGYGLVFGFSANRLLSSVSASILAKIDAIQKGPGQQAQHQLNLANLRDIENKKMDIQTDLALRKKHLEEKDEVDPQALDPQLLINNLLSVTVQEGFSKTFLSSGEVSLPILANTDNYVFIHHQNMSIYFNKERKLALYSSCNYDKVALFESMKRSNSFRDDPSLDSSFQLGKGFYGSRTLDNTANQNFFDRGHLIARRYNQWGATEEEARRGERDTYFHTTIHPQVKELNQEEWEELESFIIEHGKLDTPRVSVIAGALLHPNDPTATYEDSFYRDKRTIKIPIVYWKVIYYSVENELRKICFLMSQRNRLKELDFVKFSVTTTAFRDPFDEIADPLKTYIIHSSLLQEATGLTFAQGRELYNVKEPLAVVIKDNETHPAGAAISSSNIIQFV